MSSDLRFAAKSGDLATVIRLLAIGINPDETSANGWTALMLAAREGNVEIAERLLESGANPNIVSVNGSTALSMAIKRGNVQAATVLLGHGAIIEQDGDQGRRLIQLISKTNYLEMLQLLIDHGANPLFASYDLDEERYIIQALKNGHTVGCKVCGEPLSLGTKRGLATFFCPHKCTNVYETIGSASIFTIFPDLE